MEDRIEERLESGNRIWFDKWEKNENLSDEHNDYYSLYVYLNISDNPDEINNWPVGELVRSYNRWSFNAYEHNSIFGSEGDKFQVVWNVYIDDSYSLEQVKEEFRKRSDIFYGLYKLWDESINYLGGL